MVKKAKSTKTLGKEEKPASTPPPAEQTPNGSTESLDDDAEDKVEEQGQQAEATKDMKKVYGFNDDVVKEIVNENALDKALKMLNQINIKPLPTAQDNIKLDKDDVEILMKELEITKPVAEQHLRSCNGNLQEFLLKYISV
ncbi:hypothetical protein HK098_002825 [Nowakowskiella sp. JEL0407]|nr:hypothetical protein HK098_002825 [Nowakowskiella sp. JEL0407]